MARPKKDAGSKARPVMGFRPKDAAEETAILERIEESGLSRSEFLRQMALSGHIKVTKTVSKDFVPFEVVKELNDIGVNLNQAMKKLHVTGSMPAELPALLAEIEIAVTRVIEGELTDHGS